MSSKKPFDHIEEKIKQAAENSLPAFDEKAWQAMEAKLDSDKKKRRPVLWWFILPLLLAAGWGGYSLYNERAGEANISTVVNAESKNSTSELQEQNAKKPATGIPGDGESVQPLVSGDQDSKTGDTKKTLPANSQAALQKTFDQDVVTSASNTAPVSKRNRISGKRNGSTRLAVTDSEVGDAEATQKGDDNLPRKEVAATGTEPERIEKDIEPLNNGEQEKVTAKPDTESGEKQVLPTEAVKETAAPAEKKKEKVQDKKQHKGLYLLAAGGADAGSTKFLSFANSNVTPKYGLGIGYRFNKRWSVQTGFYATNKKYVAGPGDYTFKPGSPMSTYTIDKIKAACLVYEIPVAIRYDMVNSPSFSLYVTAGAASYIIQKEKYNCSYWYYNNLYEQEWKYSGNRHLFSTAMFAVGIEKPLSSKFSLLLEPSVSIPLTGVGDGKMNIYSAAALLGIKYYPFKK
jgi:Outer membrane protein beta-barrel domain